MTSLNRELIAQIRKRFCDAGQGHVFTWWDDLSAEEREGLFRQLTSIDLELIHRLVAENLKDKPGKEERVLEPITIIPLPSNDEDKAYREAARVEGETIIREGRCAAFMMAGSMDREAGGKVVKGKQPITPVTGKSLFQLHAEKLISVQRRYGVDIPLFIMTSEGNHGEIKDFFENHDYFGLPGEEIFFFMQGMLPAVDLSGKLLMKSRGRLWMGPDGHGGSIRSLYASGALEEMERRGIEYIFFFQVDNPLTVMLDPVFLGCHQMAGTEISSKVVHKRSPEEKVGVLGKVNGWPGVVEYKDLSQEEKYACDEEGHLKFYAGNTAMHILDVAFVRRLSAESFKLGFHKNAQTIDTIDDKGETQPAKTANAIVFESFVFDTFKYAKNTINLEVARESEFSPLKETEGEDSPDRCRIMLSNLYKSWLTEAGFSVNENKSVFVEISPLFALDAEEFVTKVKERGEVFSEKLFIQ